jgi:hypothetical protein
MFLGMMRRGNLREAKAYRNNIFGASVVGRMS